MPMYTSSHQVDPLQDSTDQNMIIITDEHSNIIQDQSIARKVHMECLNKSLDCPPRYWELNSISKDEKAAQVPIAPPPDVIHISEATETEWFESLRELQVNITDLHAARGRMSKLSLSTLSYAPKRWRSQQLIRVEECSREVRVLEELILAGMHRLSRIHSDPTVQTEWASRANDFSRSICSVELGNTGVKNGIDPLPGTEGASASDPAGARAGRYGNRIFGLLANRDNDSSLTVLQKGVGIILLTPVALAGATAFAAGTMVYGSGKIVVGLGHMLTFGKLR